MCDKPLEERKGIFYIRVSPLPQWISDDEIVLLFSRFGPIEHFEVHGDCKGKLTGDHIYIGYRQLPQAVRALDTGRFQGGYRFDIALTWQQFSISHN